MGILRINGKRNCKQIMACEIIQAVDFEVKWWAEIGQTPLNFNLKSSFAVLFLPKFVMLKGRNLQKSVELNHVEKLSHFNLQQHR